VDVFQLRSFNFPDFYIRHRNFLGELTEEAVGEQEDFSFELVNRGHDPQGRSLAALRSVNFPALYLRHRDFRLRLEGPNGSGDQLFRKDSAFYIEPGLAHQAGSGGISFRSFNYPDRYIRHRDFHLWVEPRDSANLAPDATFIKTVRID
jgi:hypothetical protein